MEDEYRRYGDSTILEPIIEQQDDEVRQTRDRPGRSNEDLNR